MCQDWSGLHGGCTDCADRHGSKLGRGVYFAEDPAGSRVNMPASAGFPALNGVQSVLENCNFLRAVDPN